MKVERVTVSLPVPKFDADDIKAIEELLKTFKGCGEDKYKYTARIVNAWIEEDVLKENQ